MNKKKWILLTITVLFILYLTLNYLNSSSIGREYIRNNNYLILWAGGDIHTITYDKKILLDMPYDHIWSLQETSPAAYVNEEVTTEKFLGFSMKNGLRNLYVIKTGNVVIGGYSSKINLVPSNGNPESIDGKTSEEIHNGSLQDWYEELRLELEE